MGDLQLCVSALSRAVHEVRGVDVRLRHSCDARPVRTARRGERPARTVRPRVRPHCEGAGFLDGACALMCALSLLVGQRRHTRPSLLQVFEPAAEQRVAGAVSAHADRNRLALRRLMDEGAC